MIDEHHAKLHEQTAPTCGPNPIREKERPLTAAWSAQIFPCAEHTEQRIIMAASNRALSSIQ